ncbi:hypothetical protein A3J90_02510 [candidate division WOR-1 bacterium RIFOXYC2_FULL_37_10]|uniref:FlgD Ig-like domain-containing protein n=1 Tax=candidate division WOR-1 bacterium RIFOXYB2_FULL_37_13 TaxID=1802579 RepID=A0A1F4SUI5_UNCSA|nr:MAG: hypothetical protein A2246_06880 [candidate division WOR-1 bacterium RIFOXYA2_FULL_37_7]OGC24098.1 MAG: hypothetical protein A2310_05110 [candidate division WOR-1 bacterium RIFOXYB2_FULL_37_13]OGC32729.1 MAG: hypothetical protein A3J90_02510 [candidate division WOR-1 bacterium RIFOXYC2_FULL_37_10]
MVKLKILIFCFIFFITSFFSPPAHSMGAIPKIIELVVVAIIVSIHPPQGEVQKPPSYQPPKPKGYSLDVSLDGPTEVPWDGESARSFELDFKKDGDHIDNLPEGAKLYVCHVNVEAPLIQMNAGNKAYVGEEEGDISIKRIYPFFNAVNRITEIDYFLNPNLYNEIISVTLNVYKAIDGSLIYARTESLPLNSSLKPFIWNGKNTQGEILGEGDYLIEVVCSKNGKILTSKKVKVSLKKPIGTTEEEISYSGIDNSLLLFSPEKFSNKNSDKVSIVVKDKENKELTKKDIDISFAKSSQMPSPSESFLNFSTNVAGNIDGIPIKIENINASSTKTSLLRLTVFDGDASQAIIYELDKANQTVRVKDFSIDRVYSLANSKDKENCYVILSKINDLMTALYNSKGLSFDVNKNSFNFDSKYVQSIAPGIKLSSTSVGDLITLKAEKEGEVFEVSYNVKDGIISNNGSVQFASNYSLDDQVVSAASASQDNNGYTNEIGKSFSFAIQVSIDMRSLIEYIFVLMGASSTNLYPKHYIEPVINNCFWNNEATGNLILQGTLLIQAEEGDKSSKDYNKVLQAYVNGKPSYVFPNTRDGSWTFSTSVNPLSYGENKINIIVLNDGIPISESGDITVYWTGSSNVAPPTSSSEVETDPYDDTIYPASVSNTSNFILLEPRDRQIFGVKFSNNSNSEGLTFLKVSGIAVPNGNEQLRLSVNGYEYPIEINSGGNFSGVFEVLLKESENIFKIYYGNKTYSKTIIGTIKFSNSPYRNLLYVVKTGDFLFNVKKQEGFNWIPMAPDHTGIYVGNGKVVDAVWNTVQEQPISTWVGQGLYTITSVPKIVDTKTRIEVGKLVSMQQSKYGYDIPLLGYDKYYRYGLVGHYDGPDNGKFYCSELAYWGWEKTVGIGNFGLEMSKLIFPVGEGPLHGSILPAFLCRESMMVKREEK